MRAGIEDGPGRQAQGDRSRLNKYALRFEDPQSSRSARLGTSYSTMCVPSHEPFRVVIVV